MEEGEKAVEVAHLPHAVCPMQQWFSLGGDFAPQGTFGRLGRGRLEDATGISLAEARNPA